MESDSDNTISTNQNKVLKMAMQMNQANLDVWLDRQSTDLMREEEVSETVALAYQKMMVLVSEREAIQAYLMEQESVELEQIIPPLRAAEAAALMSHEHLLTENEIAQLYALLLELEA